MKFTIKKSVIQDVLSKVQGLTGRKSNLTITTSVLIQSVESGVKISATDLETGFEGFYLADVSVEGKITINAKKLYEIVSNFPSDEILIHEVDNHWIEINNQNVEYHIVGLNADDFPVFPKIENIPFFEIDSDKFKKMVEQTAIITGSGDEKRAHIIGLFFEIINNDAEKIIRLVSTDGNRLSKTDCIFESNVELPAEAGYIIPKKGLVESNKFMVSEGTIKMGFKDNHFILKKDKETIIIRLLEGDFPLYRDILENKNNEHIIKLEKQKFLMMLKRMSILSSEDYKGVVFKFLEDKLLINSTNPDIGESKEEMAMAYKGDPIEVAFNPRYFIDSLNCIENETINVNIISEEKPCFLEGDEDNTYLSVIMPMRM